MNINWSFLFVVLLVVFINIFFSFFDFRFDLTKEKKHTISEETTAILNDLDDVVFIRVYLDGDLSAQLKHLRLEAFNLLKSFKLITGKNLDFEFVNPNEKGLGQLNPN